MVVVLIIIIINYKNINIEYDMSKRHSILYKYYKKFIINGGYNNFTISEDELSSVTKPPATMFDKANKLFPEWYNNKDYINLINYMNDTEDGQRMKNTLLTYYDNNTDEELYKRDNEEDQFYIKNEYEYILTCIAFLAEYKKLKKDFNGLNPEEFIINTDNYWKTLYDFISKTACMKFVGDKSKDQK